MLNLSSIRSIAKDSEESQTIFNSLAERKRTRKITDLRQLQYKLLDEGAKLTKEDVMKTFKALEDAGVGSIIIGRKGKPTRFKWNYSIKRVAKAGVPTKLKKNEPLKVSSKKMNASEFSERVKGIIPLALAENSFLAVISTTVKIRPNFSSKIELPLDLKKEDIDELTKILYSLVQVKEVPAQNKSEPIENKEIVNLGSEVLSN
jgi:hypothetical protein